MVYSFFLEFPAGILQGHFFNAQRPKYMNFGAIGYVIGHEITHGFDDQGRQFDVKGNLRDWWQPDTQKAYLAKAKCIIEQYGNYTERATGLNVRDPPQESRHVLKFLSCTVEWHQYPGREHRRQRWRQGVVHRLPKMGGETRTGAKASRLGLHPGADVLGGSRPDLVC